MNGSVGSRAQTVFKRVWPSYLGYTLSQLLLIVYLAPKGIWRARRRNYDRIIWARLFLTSLIRAPRRSNLVYGLGIGEARAAAKFVQVLHENRDWEGYVLTETQEAITEAYDGVTFYPAPFNNPVSALASLLILRPKVIWVVENLNNHHFKAMAALLGIPVVLFNVQDSIELDLNRSGSSWRVPLIGLYATQSESQATLLSTALAGSAQVFISGPVAIGLPRLVDSEAQSPESWRKTLGILDRTCPIILAGSTHPEDESKLVRAFLELRKSWPVSLLVIAPRQISRIPEVRASLGETGLTVRLRSEPESGVDPAVILLDSVGELRNLYSICDIAFVGGTFDQSIGGHTPLEALGGRCFITSGPWFAHQREVMELLNRNELVHIAASAEELESIWLKLLHMREVWAGLGDRIDHFLRESDEATVKFYELVRPNVERAVETPR